MTISLEEIKERVEENSKVIYENKIRLLSLEEVHSIAYRVKPILEKAFGDRIQVLYLAGSYACANARRGSDLNFELLMDGQDSFMADRNILYEALKPINRELLDSDEPMVRVRIQYPAHYREAHEIVVKI
jgi:hypothetical protein